MLDPVAADLADAVARLCVLRTEDYVLINTVYKRERSALSKQQQQQQQQKPHSRVDGSEIAATSSAASAAYIRYLTEEVEKRETERCAVERRWGASVREWAQACLSENDRAQSSAFGLAQKVSSAAQEQNAKPLASIAAFWSSAPRGEEAGETSSFQQMYAAVVRHAYELTREDLTSTPFAQLPGSNVLYHVANAAPTTRNSLHFISQRRADDGEDSGEDGEIDAGHSPASTLTNLARVHALFFSGSSAEASPFATATTPSAALESVHPLRDDDPLTDLSRNRLASSRRVWLVLFFLWCHAVSSSRLPEFPSSSQGAKIGVDEKQVEWLVESVLVKPASAFLRSQAQQLETLLAKVRRACDG